MKSLSIRQSLYRAIAAAVSGLLCICLFASCSRQFTTINQASKLSYLAALSHTATGPAAELPKCNNQPFETPSPISAMDREVQVAGSTQKPVYNNNLQTRKKAVIETVETLVSVPGLQVKNTSSYHQSRINKAGLLLIGAGLIAVLVKLIVPGLIVIGLGLIIMLAPLLRPRR